MNDATLIAVPRRRERGWLGSSWRAGQPAIVGTLSIALVFLAWQLSATYGWVNTMFLPSPAVVIKALIQVISSERFLYDLQVSAYEFGWGLGISLLAGGVLGILAGWYRIVDQFLQPLVIAINSIPNLALIPILILVFGIGVLPKILLVLLSCIVVMQMNTAAGVKSVDPQLMRMARSFGASEIQLLRTVVIPFVVPYFMTGLRICVGKAVVTVAVAEILGSSAGLGNILIRAQSNFNMPVMFAAVIILTVVGITLTQAATQLERFILRWRL